MKNALRTYYSFLWRYKTYFLLFFFCLILNAIAWSLSPYFYKLFLDNFASTDLSLVIKILIIFALVRIIAVLSEVGAGIAGDKMLVPASRDARLKFFQRINELDFAYHLSQKTGSLISTVKRGDGAFINLHFMLHWQVGSILINFVVMLFFLIRLNFWLLIAVLFAFILGLITARQLIRQNTQARREFIQSDDRVMDVITDNLMNYETVKLFAKEKWELFRLGEIHYDWMKKFRRYNWSFRKIDITTGMINNLGLLIVLVLGLIQLRSQIISLGDYMMVLGFMTSFYPRFFDLIYSARHIIQSGVDIEKYFQIFDEPVLVPDPIKPIKRDFIIGEIEFRRVTFTYPDNKRPALKDFSLHIHPGQAIALVGKSGVGKTTLGRLILRFYDVQKGQILIDGINIKRFSKDQLRSFIGVVPQEPILFNDTIGYNIAYGRAKASQEEIIAAAKMANLDEFINGLPQGYDTLVGERGVKLSGGQRQRLAIARMILSNPSIVIFDEATSQLDTESEKKIQSVFWQAVKNKTTIIIAHRLSTVINADKIVVLHQGQIVEIGSHQELIQKTNSLYSYFWHLQTQSEIL